MPLKQLHILLLAILLSSGCATIRQLEGGEKDVYPPEADSSRTYPSFNAVHVQDGRINITFKEYVKLKDPAQQIIISPAPKSTPSFTLKGKRLVFSLGDSLLPNSTYQIILGSAIEDITEGNAAGNLDLVFSTGDHLDSLTITGTAINAFSLSPLSQAGVLLYRDTTDSLPLCRRPDYYARTSTNGSFKMSYLQPGLYRMFVVKDMNANFFQDLDNEEIGFPDSLIDLRQNKQIGTIYTFNAKEEVKFPEITWKSDGTIRLSGTDESNFQLRIPSNDSAVSLTKTASYDTLYAYVPYPLSDTLAIEMLIHRPDSTFSKRKTLRVPEKKRNNPKKPSLRLAGTQFLEEGDSLMIVSSVPIQSWNKDAFRLFIDSVEVPIVITKTNPVSFMLSFGRKEEKTYTLKIDSSAITDWNSMQNDSSQFVFRTRKKEDYGSIRMDIATPDSLFYLLALLSPEGKEVQELRFSHKVQLDCKWLLPGKYQLRLIQDNNNNGKWDRGNYQKGIQPERVFYYPDEMMIRANWDLDLKWTPESNR